MKKRELKEMVTRFDNIVATYQRQIHEHRV